MTDEPQAELIQLLTAALGRKKTEKKSSGPSPGKRLYDFTRDSVSFWKTPSGVPYADVVVEGKLRTWAVDDAMFSAWLNQQFVRMVEEKDIPKPEIINQVKAYMTSEALVSPAIYKPALRVKRVEETFYYDLHDDLGRLVKCTPAGWEIIPRNEIKFISGDGMLPQVEPQGGGSLDLLRKYLSLSSEDDFRLVISWLIGAMVSSDGYPVLVLNGAQGTAKSTTTTLLHRIIDPNANERREPPKDMKDVAAIVKNCHLLTIDNVTSVDGNFSDTLCRLSTGGAMGGRTLFTNHNDSGFEAIRPVIVNGIPQFVTRNDLMERAILINLPRIDKNSRREWAGDMEPAFRGDLPLILGALFDIICTGLTLEGVERPKRLPRLAGWGRFMDACKGRLGWDFMDIWERQEALKSSELVAGDTIAQAIMACLQHKANEREDPVISGTAWDLMQDLAQWSTGERNFPKTSRGFTSWLKQIQGDLEKHGVKFIANGKGKKGYHYELRLVG